MITETEMQAWLRSTQFTKDCYFEPTGFEREVILYETPLNWSFVLTIIEGTAKSASFSAEAGCSKYRKLINVIQSATGNQEAFWFYGTDPDNTLSILSWIRVCNYNNAPEYELNNFERFPADQGGVSWLGLVGADRKWLLLHEHDPSSFSIKFFGANDLCEKIATMLGSPITQ